MDHEVMSRRDLEEFRGKVKEVRERELRRDAISARRFKEEETFQQGIDLIKFAMRIHEAGKRAGNR